jgi:hypothetical protein
MKLKRGFKPLAFIQQRYVHIDVGTLSKFLKSLEDLGDVCITRTVLAGRTMRSIFKVYLVSF